MIKRLGISEIRVDWRSRNDVVYVGRKISGGGCGEGKCVLGNRFKIGKDGSREEVIRKYRVWLWEEIKKDGEVLGELRRIISVEKVYGLVVLVCWCKENEGCHGDVLIRCIEWLKGGGV